PPWTCPSAGGRRDTEAVDRPVVSGFCHDELRLDVTGGGRNGDGDRPATLVAHDRGVAGDLHVGDDRGVHGLVGDLALSAQHGLQVIEPLVGVLVGGVVRLQGGYGAVHRLLLSFGAGGAGA